MENKRHHCTNVCVIMLMIALTSMAHAVQPLSESTLALQTAMLNNALPSILIKAQQDALKPEEERWRSQRVLSDKYLGEIRVNTIWEACYRPMKNRKK